MKFFNKIYIIRFVIFTLIGGVFGFAYYYFIGCKSGSCPIKSNPYYMTLWGLALGGVLGFKTKKISKNDNE